MLCCYFVQLFLFLFLKLVLTLISADICELYCYTGSTKPTNCRLSKLQACNRGWWRNWYVSMFSWDLHLFLVLFVSKRMKLTIYWCRIVFVQTYESIQYYKKLWLTFKKSCVSVQLMGSSDPCNFGSNLIYMLRFTK